MTPAVTLIGLGNVLMRDEGIGVHAVRELQARYEIPESLQVVDGGTSGLDLLPFIENRDKVLVVDAVNFRKEPGYLQMLIDAEIPAFFSVKSSLHHLGLVDVLAAAQLLEVAPRQIRLIGIQPEIMELGLELGELMQSKMALLLEHILAQLADWGITLTPRLS